jgi:hypothetical protein
MEKPNEMIEPNKKYFILSYLSVYSCEMEINKELQLPFLYKKVKNTQSTFHVIFSELSTKNFLSSFVSLSTKFLIQHVTHFVVTNNGTWWLDDRFCEVAGHKWVRTIRHQHSDGCRQWKSTWNHSKFAHSKCNQVRELERRWKWNIHATLLTPTITSNENVT